jgi:hypothetical protein
VLFEELPVLFRQQGAIGRDRERDLDAAVDRHRQRPLGHRPDNRSVHHRLAEEAQVHAFPRRHVAEQQIHRGQRRGQRHAGVLAAETATVGVAVRAAQVALLRDGK